MSDANMKCNECDSRRFYFRDAVPSRDSIVYCQGCDVAVAAWHDAEQMAKDYEVETGLVVHWDIHQKAPDFTPRSGLPIPPQLIH